MTGTVSHGRISHEKGPFPNVGIPFGESHWATVHGCE